MYAINSKILRILQSRLYRSITLAEMLLRLTIEYGFASECIKQNMSSVTWNIYGDL